MKRIQLSSVSNNLSEIYKTFVYFLGSYADAFLKLLEEDIDKGFNKFELIFFVEYVVCEVFKYSDLTDDAYKTVVNEFTMKYLFHDVVAEFEGESRNLVNELNKLVITSTKRMNEYKNLYPLVELVANHDSSQISFLVKDLLKNIYTSDNQLYRLEFKIKMYLISYVSQQIEAQNKFIAETL